MRKTLKIAMTVVLAVALLTAQATVGLRTITHQAGTPLYCADGGASDTYTCTVTPTLTAYTTGMTVIFKPNTANTGAASLNIDSLGAKTIVTSDNAALANNDLLAGSFHQLYYDGTSLRMQKDLNAGANHAILSATHTDSLAGTVVRGDLIIGNSTPAWARIALGSAGQVLKSDGTDLAWNSVLAPQYFPAAGCNNSAAGPALDIPTSNGAVANCFGTSPHRYGGLDFADGASALTANLAKKLQAGWTSTIDIHFEWFSASTSTNSVVWTVQTVCTAPGEDISNPTYNAVQTVADANLATANLQNTASIASITTTGCAVGEVLWLKIGRDPTHASDLLAATATLLGVELVFRTTL